jgi:hypothetical protein
MRATKKIVPGQSGVALLTTILLMLLMSSLLVGFVLLINSGQRLSGTNNDYSKAFYAAEAGMEKMTADLGTLFDQNYSPSGAQIQALTVTPPPIPGISYTKSTGGSGYTITNPVANTDTSGNPVATVLQITAGPYQGMTALATPYILDVTARTTAGSEVKLERTTQTVGIPMFQFGIFSDSDLSFFPGPAFNFGGRTHTNGNLFLASGASLTLSDRVTAVKDVIRFNLENGHPVSINYTGSVNVFNGSGTRPLGTNEGSLTTGLGSAPTSNWNNISLGSSYYAGNLRNGATGARNLQLGIVTLGGGTTQAVDVIRRPITGEATTVTQERYFSQASIKILLSDNPLDLEGPPTGTLPCTTSTVPYNLEHLNAGFVATDPTTAAIQAAVVAKGETFVPLATQGSVGVAYSPANGYWLQPGNPTITGYIKIEIQTPPDPTTCANWHDVTAEVLGYGYVGKNANPSGGYPLPPALPALPTVQIGSLTAGIGGAVPCLDGHAKAIIRLERLRDNPSTLPGNPCGVTGTTINTIVPTDFWPNVLYDTREGLSNNNVPTGTLGTINYSNMVQLGGVMQYVEIDVKNLSRYLAGLSGGTGHNTHDPNVAPNNYVLYVSDRRGNRVNPATNYASAWPPVSPSTSETGEYGYGDFLNEGDANGCPNHTLDIGEDLAGTGVVYVYGQDAGQALLPHNFATPQTGGYGPMSNLYSNPATVANALAPPQYPGNGFATNCGITNPTYAGFANANFANVWPGTFVVHANEARENPNFIFRRAVKLVNGSDLADNLDTCPGGVTCGLTIAAENPVYLQGSYNCPACTGFPLSSTDVGASIIGDAVTLLSDNWNDVNSFIGPYDANLRIPVQSYYRAAIVGGKGVYFPQPAGGAQDLGTDGGVHNFLRYLENWGGVSVFYEGSLVSLYFNRQGIGIYKSGGGVYSPPVRNYSFDTNFLQPSLLPPRTPLFRDVNTTGFTQLLSPTQ